MIHKGETLRPGQGSEYFRNKYEFSKAQECQMYVTNQIPLTSPVILDPKSFQTSSEVSKLQPKFDKLNKKAQPTRFQGLRV